MHDVFKQSEGFDGWYNTEGFDGWYNSYMYEAQTFMNSLVSPSFGKGGEG